jgi:hypothetical protein
MKTMKVRMKVGVSGTRSGVAWPQPGEVLECSEEEGMQLCAAGIAVPEPDDSVEKAVAPTPEKRATTKAKAE